jgi:hypothetical protein
MNILWILIFLILLILLFLIYTGLEILAPLSPLEPFVGNTGGSSGSGGSGGSGGSSKITINSCPSGTNKYYGKTGDILCCSGIVNGNECTSGNTVCSLTTQPVQSLPGLLTCSQLIQEISKEKSESMCPKSMPNYFFNGCTAGPVNSTGFAPLSPSSAMCRIYATDDENMTQKDSCLNVKQGEQIVCPGTNCITTVNPPLISVQYTASDGHRTQCFTRASYEKYLLLNPKLQGTIDLDTDKRICENL